MFWYYHRPQIYVTEPDLHIPTDWRHLSDLQENVEKAAVSVAAKMKDSILINSPQTWPGACVFVKWGWVECSVEETI